jgi:hypothetical protein
LWDIAKESDFSDAEFIVNELKRQSFLKSAVLIGTKQDRDFTDFIINFWDYDNSPYIYSIHKERLRKNHGIHRRYCHEQLRVVKKYRVPYFTGKLLGEISRQHVEDF